MMVALRAGISVDWREQTRLFDPDETPYTERERGKSVLHRAEFDRLRMQDDYNLPASRYPESIIEQFERLAETWRAETVFLSSVHQMSMHPAYQEIIGMGENAIPYILKDLEQTQDHWFWALSAITGINPIHEEDRGIISKMTDVWLQWGRQAGYHPS